jgi:hypothetical protein
MIRQGAKVLAILGLGIIALVAVRLVGARGKIRDSRDAMEFAIFGWDESTEYAAKYSEVEFMKVNVGMTEAEVVARLGAPLARYRYPQSNSTMLYYSKGRKRDGSYWARFVETDSTGRVVAVRRMFYTD